MRKTMKWLSVLMVVLLFGSALVCESAPKKLVVWGGVPAANGPQTLVDNWNKTHPDVQVEYVRFVNDEAGNTKLDVALLSGEQIDCYFTYFVSTMVKRIEGGMAEDLSKYGGESYVKKNIGKEGIFRLKNKLYSIPTSKEPQYFMANKALLDAAGIAVPKEWTFDEFRATCKKLTETKDGKTRYGAFYLPFNLTKNFELAKMILGTNYWYKKDGKASNFDNKAYHYEAQLFYDMLYTDKSTFPYSEILSRKMQAYSQDAFMTQEVAMFKTAPWTTRYVKDTAKYPHDWKTTFLPLPVITKGKPLYNDGALNNWIMMNSKSNYKKETWEFIKYWMETGWKDMLPAGKIPTYNKADSDEIVAGILGTQANLFDVDAFKQAALDPKIKLPNPDTITVAAGGDRADQTRGSG